MSVSYQLRPQYKDWFEVRSIFPDLGKVVVYQKPCYPGDTRYGDSIEVGERGMDTYSSTPDSNIVTIVSCAQTNRQSWQGDYAFWARISNVLEPIPIDNSPSVNNMQPSIDYSLDEYRKYLESLLTQEKKETEENPMDTATAAPATAPDVRTFEYTDGSISYVCLTLVPPGSVGTVVRRQKRRGRPVYQKVEGMLVPASAKAAGEIHAVAAKELGLPA